MKENIKNNLLVSIKAFITGSMMTIPGVSGGSTAMVLGEYDNLVGAVPGLLKKNTFVKSVCYLAIFCISAVIGIVLASKPLTYLMGKFPVVIMYFIIGTIIGSIPMIVKKSTINKGNWPFALFSLIGLGIVYLTEMLPPGLFSPSMDWSFSSILIQLVGGIIISIGLILPGISVSYMLVVFGLYEPVFTMVGELNIIPLIPLGVGLLLGVFLLTGALKLAMDRCPKITYMIILGFLLSSIVPLYPGMPSGWNILASILSFSVGAVAIFYLSKLEL